MVSGAVTNRYAQGLYAAAEEKGLVDNVEEGLSHIAEVIASHAELKQFVVHPLIKAQAKLQVLEKVFGETVDPFVIQFLRVLLRRNRSEYLTAVAARFHQMAEASRGRVDIVIESAMALSDTDRHRLETQLRSTLQKEVSTELKVNPSLLGGYRIQVGNRVLDATLRGRTMQFSEKLLAAGASKEGIR